MDKLFSEKQHIVIIDDEPNNIQLLGTILREKGYMISIAESGEDGLEVVEQGEPDLILLDIMMPGMNGFETCKKLKENPKTKDIPIIFLSALSDVENKVEGFRLGAVDFLAKPVKQAEVLARVDTHLKLRRYQIHLEEEVQKRTIELEKANRQLRNEIEENIQAQEKIKHLKNLLANIINSMPSVLVGVDPEGRITEWNVEAEKETGIIANDALGRSLEEVFPRLSNEMEKVDKVITNRLPLKTEKVPWESKGKRRFTDVTVYPLVANGVEGAVIRVDDVTDRARIMEMMIQTEKMISIGGLAAGMAHEINNPLSGILQGTQNIMRGISPKLPKNHQVAEEESISLNQVHNYLEKRNIFQYLQGIQEAGERTAVIIDNMLAFSRSNASSSPQTPINLIKLVNKTVELASTDYNLKKNYDFRKIKIIREFQDPMPFVPCIASEIQQVLLNLLSNAAQSMFLQKEKKSPEIILRVMQEEQMARIEVEDNGPGIEEKDKNRIFEPFFTTKDVGVGTGLGLSVSYFIITGDHKGTIQVETRQGEGTKFIVKLPLQY